MLARFARASRAAAAGAGQLGLSAAAATAARRAAATALSSSAASRAAAAASALGAVRQFQTGDNVVLNRFKNPAADPKTGRILALNTLKPAPSARKKAIMLGRGEGTHFGKSAGRGMRGTYHRRALHKRNFEGGQTPLHRRIPKRGHHVSPRFQERFREVSLAQLQHMAETGRIDATRPIQLKDLFACGFKPKRDGIKLIGLGAHKLVFPLHVEVSRIDELAKFAIEQAGGSVKLVYFTRLGMRAHLRPEKFAILPVATNIPPPKKRHIYMPYDSAGAIPALLWKSRIAASSPLAKFWTPSPRATRYLQAEQLRQQAMEAAAGGAKAAQPAADASTKAAN